MKINFKKSKGFSLIELIIVISLLAIIIIAGYNVFSFTNTAQKMTSTEYDLQSQVRVVSQTLNTNIRFTSALFVLPEITDVSTMEGWNYITTTNIDEDGYGDEIIDYVYDHSAPSNSPKWKERVIVESKPNIKYNLEFQKRNEFDVDKLIEFSISIKDEKTGVERSLKSEVESLNSLQIIDRGRTLNKKSKVICYRMDDRPIPGEAAVSMVLDKSGSMDRDLWGSNTNRDEERRITILKNRANELINNFDDKHNISMNIVPFSRTANNPLDYDPSWDGSPYESNSYDKFISLFAEGGVTKVLEDIDNIQAKGMTNTGDGIRKSYYNLEKYYNDRINIDPDAKMKRYMIILVDGVTNSYSVTNNKQLKSYILHDTDTIHPWNNVIGNKPEDYSDDYVEEVGKMVRDTASSNKITSFVIGFSSLPSEHGSLEYIGEATDAVLSPTGDKYFKATSDEELKIIFDSISEHIKRDLWYVYGPR